MGIELFVELFLLISIISGFFIGLLRILYGKDIWKQFKKYKNK